VYRFDEEEKEAVWRVIESGWLFRYGGQEANLHQVDQFEALFAQRMRVPPRLLKLGVHHAKGQHHPRQNDGSECVSDPSYPSEPPVTLAERVGFEPTEPRRTHCISSAAH
jgi:hypothetical protein